MLDSKVFLKLLQLDLNAHPPGAPIVKIHLAAEPARPRSAQGGLFLPRRRNRKNLELTLARIAGMVGEKKLERWSCSTRIIPQDSACAVLPPRLREKARARREFQRRKRNSAVTALRHFRPPLRAEVTWKTASRCMLVCRKKEIQGDVLVASRSLALFRRLVGSRSLVARRMGHRTAKQRGNGETISLLPLVHDLLGGGWLVEGIYD